MPEHDLIVRGGRVAGSGPGGDDAVADVAVRDGVVTAVGPSLGGSAAEEVDATGMHVLPGAVDTHVHLNAPGRDSWEGVATGTRALAAGGATTYVDMPLNSSPPTVTADAVAAKVAAGRDVARIDFALWGGLVPGGTGHLAGMAAAGVAGFKAFMCDSGLPEFPRADDRTLADGMAVAADLGLPVLVHAESEEMTHRLARRARSRGAADDPAEVVAARPVGAEVEAVARAVELAAAAGCALHVVHVASAEAAAVVGEAAGRGVDVTCETCPQYLLLGEDDLARAGAYAKAAPPPRAAAHDALWRLVARGEIPMVVSDHSPCPPEMKEGRPLLDCWGGIAGCQSTTRLLLEHGHHLRGIPLAVLSRALSTAPAERFRLPGKGRLAPGCDADLAIIDLGYAAPLRADELLYRHPRSAFEGLTHRGRIVRTVLRGVTVAVDGRPVGPPRGRQLRPGRPA